MITNIKLNKITSYTQEVSIDSLKKVNFFFGNNGSGKSTIAKFLHNLSLDEDKKSLDFKNCSQIGFEHLNNEILVFDEKFIERNFINKNVQNGIFSLNEGNGDIDDLIEAENKKLEKYNNYLKEVLKIRIKKIETDSNKDFDNLKDYCFEERKTTLKSFLKIKDTFPYKQTKNNYDEINSVILNKEELIDLSFEKLLSDYKKYYEDDLLEIKSFIDSKNYRNLRKIEIKINKLLDEIIIGNNDLDIAKIIGDLDIKNWVEEGISFLKKDEVIQPCPFCQQQTINKNLIENFEAYFDENYKNKIAKIELLKTEYKSLTSNFLIEITRVSDEYNKENLTSKLYQNLKILFDNNALIIESKIKSSNEKKQIDSILMHKDVITTINKKIQNQNRDFNNLESNKKQFELNIWYYLASQCKEEINNYKLKNYEYAIDYFFELEIEKHINEIINDSKIKIELWKEDTVTTQDAVDKINSILKNSGFEGFSIEEKEKINNISQYYLKRVDSEINDNVFKTLSEGEKNFIAFLYFFQLCLGTENILDSSKKKIIVIDDPVSSLDSQVLFIVTTLIHQLIAKKGNKPNHLELKNDNITQVFILSHNIYFYKEVSLVNRPICFDKIFYHISKTSNNTKIESKGDKNYILNDYSLLWKTLKNFKTINDNSLNITVCNTMRRILESYVNFTKIGKGENSWDSISTISVADPKYYICSALISEINDGSHKVSPLDDMFFQRIVNEVPKKLYDAFELIFKEIGEPHYDAMMNE